MLLIVRRPRGESWIARTTAGRAVSRGGTASALLPSSCGRVLAISVEEPWVLGGPGALPSAPAMRRPAPYWAEPGVWCYLTPSWVVFTLFYDHRSFPFSRCRRRLIACSQPAFHSFLPFTRDALVLYIPPLLARFSSGHAICFPPPVSPRTRRTLRLNGRNLPLRRPHPPLPISH